jgi:hypothetical protein
MVNKNTTIPVFLMISKRAVQYEKDSLIAANNPVGGEEDCHHSH